MQTKIKNLLQAKYDIKSFEADAKGNVKPSVVMHMFEDAAYQSAEEIGVGYSTVFPRSLAWVVAKYHIKFSKMPKVWENVTVETWPTQSSGITCRREFRILNEKEQVICTASTLWTLLDFKTRKLVKPMQTVEFPPLADEIAIETSYWRGGEQTRNDVEITRPVNYDNLDLNLHVNNACYVTEMINSLPFEFLMENEISEIFVNFKKEARIENILKMTAEIRSDENITLHTISNENGEENATGKIIWKNKFTK